MDCPLTLLTLAGILLVFLSLDDSVAEARAGNALDERGLQPPLCGQELFWYYPKLITIVDMFFSNHSGVTQPSLGEFQNQRVSLLILYISLPKSK